MNLCCFQGLLKRWCPTLGHGVTLSKWLPWITPSNSTFPVRKFFLTSVLNSSWCSWVHFRWYQPQWRGITESRAWIGMWQSFRMGFKWKQRGKKWKLNGNLRSYFKSLYVPCMSPTASLDAKLQKERRKKGWKELRIHCVHSYRWNHQARDYNQFQSLSDSRLNTFLLVVTCILADN